MPTLLANEQPRYELTNALSEAGEKEYRRLVRVAGMAHGRFHLFPIRSDFSPTLRAALLARLRKDLGAKGLHLRVIALNRDCWNALAALEQEAPIHTDEVVMLIGLEETPGIVAEPGAQPVRPRALAVLNQMRETLRQHISAPFFIWCPTYVYTGLLEHAPDLFDQYTGLFRFLNAEPAPKFEGREGMNIEGAALNDPYANIPTGSFASVEFYRKHLTANPQPDSRRAHALLNLVEAMLQGPGRLEVNLTEASRYVEEAIRLLAKRRNRSDRLAWARGQYLLVFILFHIPIGFTLNDTPTGNRKTNLRQAILCGKAALRVYTEADNPDEWARTQGYIGNAYVELPGGNRSVNLKQAIACYEAALRVFTATEHPFGWASTQYNLGNIYAQLPIGDEAANLQQAIACYKTALHVYTEVDYPVYWARTQNNLGNVYAQIPVGDQADNLQKAIACYKATLRVFTEVEDSVEWARTQFNLARVFERNENRESAQKAMGKAIRGYRVAGREPDAQAAEEWLQSRFGS